MVYVALLRGINVGGKNLVGMSRLKAAFEGAGMEDVATFIASGNVLFRSKAKTGALVRLLEKSIEEELDRPIKVVLRDLRSMRAIAKSIPATWKNDDKATCYVLFLSREYDRAGVLEELPTKDGVDEVRYVPGAVVWRVSRKNRTKSRINKLAGTKLYAAVTIRNCNTTRKLAELMEAMNL